MKIRIQQATGKATCKYCNTEIAKDDMEVVGNLGTGNYEGHYHLRRTEERDCKGFIETEWEDFVDPLVSSLTPENLEKLGLEVT